MSKDCLETLVGFSVFDQAELSALRGIATFATYPMGSVLFAEGDSHSQIYFVCEGTVSLEMTTPRRGRQAILSVSRGDLLAWSALVGDQVMTATAVVTTPAQIVVFDAGQLKRLLDDNIALGYKMMCIIARALSRRLLATRLQLLDVYQS